MLLFDSVCNICNKRLNMERKEIAFPAVLIIHCDRVSRSSNKKIQNAIQLPR